MLGGESLGRERQLRGRSGWRGAGVEGALVPPARGNRYRMPVAGALVGGVAGFLLGGAFWAAFGPNELTSGPAAGMSPAWEPDCTALALDRRGGHTTAGPCFVHTPPLRQAEASARPSPDPL
jgi:hypothetical protein